MLSVQQISLIIGKIHTTLKALVHEGLTEKFKEKDVTYSGSTTFTYDSFMLTAMLCWQCITNHHPLLIDS